MDEENIQTKFQVTGFMPYNPKIMINSLNFKLKIFTLLSFYSTNVASTNPTMPKTVKNVVWNFIELKSKIVIHQNNSPSQLYDLIDM